MRNLIACMLGFACAHAAAGHHAFGQTDKDTMTPEDLTIERLYDSPSLSGPSPTGVKYSPDGKRVTFLKARDDDSSRYDLWQFIVETGEQSLLVDSLLLEPKQVELSEEEKALRERKRIAGRTGIVDYAWGLETQLVVPLGGDIYSIEISPASAYGPRAHVPPKTPVVTQVTDTEAFEHDVKASPKGRYISFIRDGAVYAYDLINKEEARLTPLAEPDRQVAYGISEFVAQEEMDRYTGYWWSPDERYLVYTRVDESSVDIVERFDIKADRTSVIDQRYPRAGRPNAIVDLFVRDMETGEVTEINWRRDDWGPATDQYLARVRWAGDKVYIQAVNREQTLIRNLKGHAPDWALTSFDAEMQGSWVNLSNDFSVTPNYILTSDEESGYRHLKAWGRETETGFRMTGGDWPVDAIAGVDTRHNLVYFTGFMDTPLERHLYVQRIIPATFDRCPACANYQPAEGPPPVRVTEAGKSWSITLAPDGQSFVGTSSSPQQPPQTGLYSLKVEDGEPRHLAGYDDVSHETHLSALPPVKVADELIAWIEENALDETHPYYPFLEDHTVPEYGTLKAEDGQDLYYSIQTPPDFDPSRTYPVIVDVYGGPHVQRVTRDWERMSDQFLSRQGYIVFRLDNRGSSNRGKRFEDVIHRRMGGPEVKDQLAGVDWLKAQPFVDAERIAIQGWSYGGYMTLMTMLQAPEGTFAAAVSGAAVTDWALYDTFYTERYMGTPENNPDGYERSSVFAHADRLTTPLLLIHGMADDNVTFDNTTRLMADFQKAGKMFEVMTYPGQRHGIRGEALQIHLMKTRLAFLDRHLKR